MKQPSSQQIEIKEITGERDLKTSVRVVRQSFKTVLRAYQLNRQNCPTSAAFIDLARLNELKAKGARFFGLFAYRKLAGFVTVEKASDSLYYLEKLAVMPKYRHRGFGRALVQHALAHIKGENGKTVSIGIIEENAILKKWYQELGFVEEESKQYTHLPFTVCFMLKEL
ncbi:MAG: GNAT family N-acetyltransferase [Bacillota bacterium]